jgi:hypothetical protein
MRWIRAGRRKAEIAAAGRSSGGLGHAAQLNPGRSFFMEGYDIPSTPAAHLKESGAFISP